MLLAVAAAIMSARAENLKGIAMGVWILLLFGFLAVEYRAIDKDKVDAQKILTDSFAKITEQENANLKTTLDQSNANLKQILIDEHSSFATLLGDQQKHFATTLNQIVANDQNENRRFAELIAEQQQLFTQQQEFGEFLTGHLVPGDAQTPANICSDHKLEPNDVLIVM
jgi:hypothetical protein